MSASAVQYVRGMPVVKIFGQSVRSFRQFNAEIQAYKTFALKCCDTYQNGMIAFTVLLGSMVTFILPVGILLIQGNPQSLALAAVWLFFIIMGPGVASPIYKLTFLGGNTKEIDEAWRVSTAFWRKSPFPNRNTPKCRSRMRWSSATCHSPTKIRNRAHVPRRCAMFASRRRKAGLRRSWGPREAASPPSRT